MVPNPCRACTTTYQSVYQYGQQPLPERNKLTPATTPLSDQHHAGNNPDPYDIARMTRYRKNPVNLRTTLDTGISISKIKEIQQSCNKHIKAIY